MGNLFYRNVSPSEIKKMPFWELKYWNKWHEILAEQDEKSVKEMEKKAAKNGK